jgi:hypothetical protein
LAIPATSQAVTETIIDEANVLLVTTFAKRRPPVVPATVAMKPADPIRQRHDWFGSSSRDELATMRMASRRTTSHGSDGSRPVLGQDKGHRREVRDERQQRAFVVGVEGLHQDEPHVLSTQTVAKKPF